MSKVLRQFIVDPVLKIDETVYISRLNLCDMDMFENEIKYLHKP